MKFLVVLLLGLSAAAAIRLGYLRGKRYTYKYEGIIAHGIPEAFENDMAVRITATAHFDYLTNGFVIMRLQDIVLATIKGKVLAADRIVTRVGEGVPQTEVKEHIGKLLEMPVRFQFKARALEKEMFASKHEPEWCLNIKRAIIYHFYLPINDNEKTYQIRVDEVTVVGKCKTAYVIVNQKPYYRVKRVIDLTRCIIRPEMWQSNVPNHDEFIVKRQGRGTAKTLPRLLRSAAYMHYDLQGNIANGFLTRKCVSESEHDLTMFGDNYGAGKAVAARTRQRLVLHKKEQPIPESAKKIVDEEKRGGLLFVYDSGWAVTNTEEAQKNILAEVATLIAAMKDQVVAVPVNPELAQTFTRLVSALRRCNQKSLELVVKDCMAVQNLDLRKLLIDALARVGTVDAAVILKRMITEGKLKDHLTRVLFGVGWVRNVNVDVMKHVMDICKHQNVVAKVRARRTCWLSFGTLFNRLMIVLRRYPRLTQHTRIMAMKGIFAKTLKEGVANAKDNEERIIFIKANGNAGWTTLDVFKTVVGHVTDTKMPLHVRLQAVWALRHMVRCQPLLVRQYLLPIFANPIADPELRTACYMILFHGDPSLLTCQMMASVLAREAAGKGPRSNQLVSFIASDLRTSIKLDRLDIVKASRARVLLRFIPCDAVFGLFAYSKAINLALDTENKIAVEMRVHKINGPETFIPRHFHQKLKIHLPGISADFLGYGARVQGIHDILQPIFEPKAHRQTRSLDILNYIFGVASDDKGAKQEPGRQKLVARFATYFKLFGSETYFGKLAKEDLFKILKDALFGEGTATEAGITFTKTGIKYKDSFTAAHLLTEQRYMIATITGFPLKLSNKMCLAIKGQAEVDITGVPQLITSNFENIQATIKVLPNVAIHMHNKVGVWLPVFETGVIVRNQVLTAPKIHANVKVTKTGFALELPTAQADQQILNMRAIAHAVIRKELTPGIAVWKDIDLGMKMRGVVEINPERCYGGDFWGVAACVKAKIADLAYIRTQRLPAFPYLIMNNLNIALKNGQDPSAKFLAKYDITANNAETYTGAGEVDVSGKKARKITFEQKCDKKKWTCNVDWLFKHYEMCPAGCKAKTVIDAATANRVAVRHDYGVHNYANSVITFENEGKLMRMVNTWKKLPEKLRQLLQFYHPTIIAFLHRHFGIQGVLNGENKCEVRVKLHNKLTADIFVDAPTLKLRRINHQLPFELQKFPTTRLEIKTILRSHYATCHVKGNNYIKTTDNVIIKQKIPGTCPFCLADDGRGLKAAWRILLKLTEQGQQNVVAVFKDTRIELLQDLTVKVNGKKVTIQPEYKTSDVRISLVAGNKLFVEAQAGFECLFDGSQAVLNFHPWWRNRIQGVCGNNDAEQWTDLITRRKTFAPETMTREFIRDWVVEGKDCKDKQCKLQARNIKLAAGAPEGKVCFTNGRFLQCVAKCEPLKKETVTVAHHCLPANSPLIEKIKQGDKTVDLLNMSVDIMAAVVEHHACKCDKCT